MEQMIDLFTRGGAVMWIIAGLSVYVVAAIVTKIYQFLSLESYHNDRPDSPEHSLKHASTDSNPVAMVVAHAVEVRTRTELDDSAKKDDIARYASDVLAPLSSHLKGLDLVANIAPLLGLLGTVIGMVEAFSVLEQSGSKIDPSLLAGGIWTALLTTVAGLSVAIPAYCAHHIFSAKLEAIRTQMRNLSIQILTAKPTDSAQQPSTGTALDNAGDESPTDTPPRAEHSIA